MDSHVLGQVRLEKKKSDGQLQCDNELIHHLVHELLVTDCARMRKLPVVPVLAPLQGPVVAELFATLWTDIPGEKVFPEISIFTTLMRSLES